MTNYQNTPARAEGGIFTVQDVIDYARNGASLFQIGSALVSEGIAVFARIKKELKGDLRANGYQNIEEVVGAAHRR